MTREELYREVQNRVNELTDSKKQEAYDYISNFMEDYKMDSILDILEIDVWEYIKCRLYVLTKDEDINEISQSIDSCKEIFENLRLSAIRPIIEMINVFYKAGKIDDVIRLFKANSFMEEVKYLNPLIDIKDASALKLSGLKKKMEMNNYDFVPFLEAVKKYGQNFLKEIDFYRVYRDIMSSLSNKAIAIHTNTTNPRKIEELKIKALTEILEDDYNVKEIVDAFASVKEFKEEYERVDRNNQRELSGLEQAKVALESNESKKQIVNYRDIIRGIKSQKIKYLFLVYIKEHNEKYCEELQEELNKLKQDSKVSIQALLNDYGIPKDSYDYDSLPTYTKEELETILKVLSKLRITNEEKLRIIRTTSMSKISSIKDYLERNILTIEYVSCNTQILEEDSTELDNFKTNMDLLKNYGVSLSIFHDSIDILMNDPSFISNNLSILNTYNLLQSLSSTKDFRFLSSEDLERVIDKYLELGFEEYLESDLSLLNRTELERLEVLKVIGIPITSKEELERYLDKDFFIPKEEIPNYLVDESIYVEEPKEVKDSSVLEQYKSTNRVYDFNGTKISINKVSRLLDQGNTLYQSIINNTHLTEEELLGIIRIIGVNKPKELKRTSEN